jgi:anti-anti-sigma factor
MNKTYVHVTVEEHGSSVVLTLLDDRITQYECAEELTDELTSAAGEKFERIVIDFSRVEFMSSVGYRPFISLCKEAKKRDAKIVICGLTPDMQVLFQTTQLLVKPGSKHFGFILADSVQHALETEV